MYSVIGTLQNPQSIKLGGKCVSIWEGVVLTDGDIAFRVTYYEYLQMLKNGEIGKPIPSVNVFQEEDKSESSNPSES